MAIPIVQKQRDSDPIAKLAAVADIVKTVYGISVDSKNLDLARQKLAQQEKQNQAELEAQQQQLENKGLKDQAFTEKDIAAGGYEVSDKPRAGYNRAFILPYGSNEPKEMYIKKPLLLDPFGAKALGAEKTKIELEKIKEEKALGAKPTAEQSKAAAFAKRLEQAEGVFSKLAESGDYGVSVEAAAQRSKLFPEAAKSVSAKQRDQAERNFVNSILRRESGAAISPSEFDSAEKQYFPRIGDTPEVIEQKRQNRILAIDALSAEAGSRAIGAIEQRQALGKKSQPKASGPKPGDIVRVNGKRHQVAEDGDTLIPLE